MTGLGEGIMRSACEAKEAQAQERWKVARRLPADPLEALRQLTRSEADTLRDPSSVRRGSAAGASWI